MIDYLVVFPDDVARSLAFPLPEDASPWTPCWDSLGGTVMPVRIIVAAAVMSEDGETLISPTVFGPGSWVALRTATRSAEIEAMSNCMLASDPDLAAAGERYVHFCRLQPETILGQVSPVFSGDGYVIPAGQPASVLGEWLIEE